MVTAKKQGEEEVQIKSDPVLDNIASFIIELFIKEDVNSFAEADLMHDLLVYKLDTVAAPVMENTVRKVGNELKSSKKVDLKKVIGGINQQKRIMFRSAGQYNAFISLFFRAVENKPELTDFIDDEASFENFMILCINEYREMLEDFVARIVEDRLALERKKKLYANRNRADIAWEDVPTYADYVAERMDAMIAPPQKAAKAKAKKAVKKSS
jgi:hypothetical protein